MPLRNRNAVQDDRAPEIEPRSDPGDGMRSAGIKVFNDEGLDILLENPSRRQLVAIARFGQERFASESLARLFDRLFECQMFKRVERVVVDEDADRTLRGQHFCEGVDDSGESVV